MSYIKSRKHAAAPHALAVLAASLSLPMTPQAQPAAPAAAAASAVGGDEALPVIKVRSQREVPYKADVSASSKLTQPLLETPKTIQVVKKEILQEQGAGTLMEALRNTPGITMQLGENGNTSAGDTFQLRGFSAQTSTFVDGVRDLSTATRDVFNIEQVEIVKGPAGADVGRGASGGYINLISKLPTLDNVNAGALNLGTASKKRLTGDFNNRLGESTALRLNVMTQDSDVAGRDLVRNKGWGVAPSIAFGLGTPTRLYLYSQHVRQDNLPDGGISTIGMDGFYNASAAIRAGAKVRRENFYGSVNDREKVDVDMVTAKLEMDQGGGTVVRNVSRYGRTHMDRVMTGINTITATDAADPSTWTISRSRQRVDQINEILANQTSVNASFLTRGLKHDVSAGMELMYERQLALGTTTGSSSTVQVVLNGQDVAGILAPSANLYQPNPNDTMGDPLLTGADTEGKTVTQAFYAFDTVTLNDAWKLSAGLRVEHYETTTRSGTLVTGGSGGNLATYSSRGYDVGSIVPSSLSDSDWLTSWNLAAVYKAAPNGTIYAAIANSLTPPGGNNFSLSATAGNAANGALDPQETTSYELGTKWELLDKHLNVSAALYRTENDKQVTQDSVTQTYLQSGKTRVEGLELAVVGQLSNFWQLSAGVETMKTKQLDQRSVNSGTGAVTVTDAVRWSPDLTASVWTSYTLGDFTVGGGLRHVSEQKRTITDADLSTQNMPKIQAYTVADLMLAYKLSRHINLQLNVTNLFDKDYLSTLNNGGSRATMGLPRAVAVTASMQL